MRHLKLVLVVKPDSDSKNASIGPLCNPWPIQLYSGFTVQFQFVFCALGFDCLQLIAMCPEGARDSSHYLHQRVRSYVSYGHHAIRKMIDDCAELWHFDIHTVFFLVDLGFNCHETIMEWLRVESVLFDSALFPNDHLNLFSRT